MKTISNALAAHLSQPSTSVAMLWKVVRTDGVKLGLTDHDRAITFNDGTDTVAYLPNDGATGSATDTSATDTSNQSIVGFLESDAITEADIFAGLYDYATIEVRLVNWADLTMGCLLWKKATLGEVKTKNGQYEAELRGLEFWLSVNMGELYGPQCRADLGDTMCGIDLSLWIQSGAIDTVTDRRTFTPSAGLVMRGSSTPASAAPANWFSQGVLKFTSGANNGFSMEVASWDGTVMTLFEGLPYALAPGDTFTVEPGCDRSISTCQSKYNNFVNHRGEPFIPGMDQITLYPNAGGNMP